MSDDELMNLNWLVCLSVAWVVLAVIYSRDWADIVNRLVKIESRDSNKDLRMVWDKIRSIDSGVAVLRNDNARIENQIRSLNEEVFFADCEEECEECEEGMEDDEDSDDIDASDYEDCSVYYFVEKSINAGHFVHLGTAYRVTVERNEG